MLCDQNYSKELCKMISFNLPSFLVGKVPVYTCRGTEKAPQELEQSHRARKWWSHNLNSNALMTKLTAYVRSFRVAQENFELTLKCKDETILCMFKLVLITHTVL